MLAPYMNDGELTKLCTQITLFLLSDWTEEKGKAIKLSPQLKNIDFMYFGWNIGKAFSKKRIHTATFIKYVFAHALLNLEVSTIERKMSHTESECRIKLDDKII